MNLDLLFESYMSCLLLEARDKDYVQKLEAAGFQDAQEITDTLVSWNNPKKEKAALKWILDRTADLDEDKEKIDQAFDLIEKQHLDFQKFASLDDVLSRSDTSTERIKAKQKFDPDKEPCFTDKKALEDGVVVYQVEDSKNGQEAVRNAADVFFGNDFNGWCIIAKDGDKLRPDSWSHWMHYSAYPKRIAFKDGKLLSFSAGTGYDDPEDYYDFFEEDDPEETSDQQFCIVWWNRKDRPSVKIPGTWADDDRDFIEAHGYDRAPEVRSLLKKAADKEAVAMKYATDKDPRIRMEVARSEFVTEKALELLVCDDDSDVRRPAVNSKKCTEDLMQKALLKHPKDGTLYEIIMKHPNASVEFMEKNLEKALSIEAFEFFATNSRVPTDRAAAAVEHLLEGLDPVKNGNKHFDFTFYNIIMALRRRPEAAFAEVLLSWARKIIEQCKKDDPSFSIDDGMYRRAISIIIGWKDIPEKTREEGLELLREFE